MSLTARLIGVIGLAFCCLLAVVVYLALWQGRDVERLVREVTLQRLTVLDYASAHVAAQAPEHLRHSGIVNEQGLDDRFVALLVLRPDHNGEPFVDPAYAYGTDAFDDARTEHARALARRVLAPVWAARERGEVYDVGTPVHSELAVARAYRSAAGGAAGQEGLVVYYLELAPDPETDLSTVGRNLGRNLFLAVVGVALVLFVLAWWIVDRSVARPLQKVAAGAERVADGDYSTPVPPAGGDDQIQRVVAAFNTMMVELDQFQGQLKERIGAAVRDARRTQDSLVIAQRLAATGRLAAGIAHEVNNPLAGMLNAVRSLRTRDMTPERREEYLELIEEGLERIQRTVAKILQFTPHKVAPRPLALDDVVRPVLALARHRIEREEVETVVELVEDALVFGDLYELQQALLNVVLNALDAMADVPDRRSRLFLRVETAGDEVRLLVRDNGTGMAPEDLEHAFDLFFTTKETGKGSGMGLATVHKILSDHGGRVELRPRGSEGMDVELVLPRMVPS